MFKSKENQTGLIIGLLALGLIVLSFLLLGSIFDGFGLFMIMVGLIILVLFFYEKNRIAKGVLLIGGLLFALFLIFSFGMMCFDNCPDNSQIVITLVVLSLFIYISNFVWHLFKGEIGWIIIVILGFVSFITLITSTAFGA